MVWPQSPLRRLGQARPEDLAEALRREGAIVTIQVQVPSVYAEQLRAGGQAVPPPQVVKGLVDTGASISTVSEAVAQAAGLQQVGTVPLYGVGGGGEKPVFAASFGLPDYGVTVDPIEVGGVTIGMPGVDILVGRDLLKALFLAYGGPVGVFSLTEEPGNGIPALPAGGPVPSQGWSTETWLLVGGGAAAVLTAALVALDVL